MVRYLNKIGLIRVFGRCFTVNDHLVYDHHRPKKKEPWNEKSLNVTLTYRFIKMRSKIKGLTNLLHAHTHHSNESLFLTSSSLILKNFFSLLTQILSRLNKSFLSLFWLLQNKFCTWCWYWGICLKFRFSKLGYWKKNKK